MPRHDWRDDELMSRERGNLGYDRDRGYRGFDDRDRGAYFDRDREEPSSRRRRTGGWGSLLADES